MFRFRGTTRMARLNRALTEADPASPSLARSPGVITSSAHAARVPRRRSSRAESAEAGVQVLFWCLFCTSRKVTRPPGRIPGAVSRRRGTMAVGENRLNSSLQQGRVSHFADRHWPMQKGRPDPALLFDAPCHLQPSSLLPQVCGEIDFSSYCSKRDLAAHRARHMTAHFDQQARSCLGSFVCAGVFSGLL